MTPSFFSWLGRGTSRRGLPVMPSGGPFASVDGVTSVAWDFVAEEDMHAEGPRRRGIRAEDGFAGMNVSRPFGGNTCRESLPLRAKVATDRVDDNIVVVVREK